MADVTRETATAHVIEGATTKGYIGPWRYMHGPVRFEYLVPLPEQRRQFYRAMDKLEKSGDKEKEQEYFQAGWAVDYVTSWNQTYHDDHEKAGESLPIEPERFLELNKRVQNRIVAIMLMQEQSELDPEDITPEGVAKHVENSELSAKELLEQMRSESDAKQAEQLGNSKGPSAS